MKKAIIVVGILIFMGLLAVTNVNSANIGEVLQPFAYVIVGCSAGIKANNKKIKIHKA